MSRAGIVLEERGAVPLWRNVSFTLMWSSVAASGFGDRLIQLGAWALLGIGGEETQAASVQAGVALFFFLPYLVFGPVGGWLADTLPRKWILLSCDELRGLLLLWSVTLVPVGAAEAIPGEHHWKVYGLIFLVGVLAAVFSPTKAATIPQIVPVKQLQSANAIVLGIAVIASLIGFGLGGMVIDRYSTRAGLLMGFVLYAGSGTFFAFLRLRGHAGVGAGARPGELARLVEAAGYLRRHRPVLELTVLSVLFWSAAHIVVAATASLCKGAYGVSAEVLVSRIAVMQMFIGIGMLMSSLVVAWMGERRESSWLAMGSLLLTGVCLLLLSVSGAYWEGVLLGFLVGFFGNAAMICVVTLIQALTPNYILGRVFGVRDLLTTGTGVGINVVIWRMPAADEWMVPALVVTAVMLAAVAGWGLWREVTRGPEGGALVSAVCRLVRLYVMVWHRARWIGKHHVPRSGAVILAANHTTGLDPLLIQSALPRLVRWVMLKSYQFRVFKPLWDRIEPIAIEHNGGDVGSLRETVRRLRAGEMVGIFPEGGLQREERVLKEFRPGIGLLARRGGAKIVPVWIDGTPRVRGMLWHFLKPSRSTVIFGEAYKPEESWDDERIAEDLRERMLKLAPGSASGVGGGS